MIYLMCAILSSGIISILMKLSKSYITNEMALLSANYFICILCSLFFVQDFHFNNSMYLGILNGFFYWISFVLFQSSIQTNGMTLSCTFQKLGILVPTLLSIFIFHEISSCFQIIGICLAIVCIVLLQNMNTKQKVYSISMLVCLLLFNGSADAMSKVFEQVGTNDNLFLVITFLVAFLFCVISILKSKQRIKRNDLLFGILIGIPNYFSARFLLKSLYVLPSLIVYPCYSVFTIVFVGMIGSLCFKEQLNKKYVYILMGFMCALILLNDK